MAHNLPLVLWESWNFVFVCFQILYLSMQLCHRICNDYAFDHDKKTHILYHFFLFFGFKIAILWQQVDVADSDWKLTIYLTVFF